MKEKKLRTKNNRFNKRIKIVIIIVGMLLMGSFWQKKMQQYETKIIEITGEINVINSHKMHSYSVGNGDYTIVFITGSGTPSSYTDFYYLQSELKYSAKTFSFDHAGFGFSESTDIPRRIDILVDELHQLLHKTNQESPYILVCHSLGSLEALRYAQIYPDEVRGIVFMDAGSPEYYEHCNEYPSKILNRISFVLRVTGINRLLGNIGIKLPLVGENLRYPLLPDDIKKIDEAAYYNMIGNKANIDVINRMNENASIVVKNGNVGKLPLLVLSSDTSNKWVEVQEQLSTWSSNSILKIIENSSHYIHWSNQDDVITYIQDFISYIE